MLAVKMFAMLLLVTAAVDALSCPKCDTTICVLPKICRGGLTYDVCGCCRICAKILGEECAGPWNYKGRCDAGLECDNNTEDFNAVGHCKAKPKPA